MELKTVIIPPELRATIARFACTRPPSTLMFDAVGRAAGYAVTKLADELWSMAVRLMTTAVALDGTDSPPTTTVAMRTVTAPLVVSVLLPAHPTFVMFGRVSQMRNGTGIGVYVLGATYV
ncbi:MAG TPA: hypothetical protein VGI86_15745 [Acidimicrobiia bacterium]